MSLVPPLTESLCLRCTAHRLVRGRASTFLLCTALPRKYPPQPVLRCEAFEETREAPGKAETRDEDAEETP